MKKYLLIGLIISGCCTIKPTQRIEFEAAGTYPEGIAFDPNKDVFYVSSMTTGAIGKVSTKGEYSVLYSDTTLKSSFGLKLHPDGKRLFVCTGDPNYSKYSTAATKKKLIRLIVIDVNTGKKTSETDLSGLINEKHFLNDLAFDDKGNSYFTDSYSNAVYKIADNGTTSVFASDKQFETAGNGLNGIVFHKDGFLLVDNSATGSIYKIDVNDPKKVQKVAIEQYFLGADGLVLNDDNKLTVVVNGGSDKIVQLTTTDNWQSAKVTGTTLAKDRFTYPATATMKGNEIWIMNAKTSELSDSNTVPSKVFAIQRAVIKPVP